jgi:hypothetical protein
VIQWSVRPIPAARPRPRAGRDATAATLSYLYRINEKHNPIRVGKQIEEGFEHVIQTRVARARYLPLPTRNSKLDIDVSGL